MNIVRALLLPIVCETVVLSFTETRGSLTQQLQRLSKLQGSFTFAVTLRGTLDKYPKERYRLQALLVRNGVIVVFTGHEHLYLRKVVYGVLELLREEVGLCSMQGKRRGASIISYWLR